MTRTARAPIVRGQREACLLARKAAAATVEDELEGGATLPTIEPRRHEILGIVALALTSLVALSLVSYDARGGENSIGVLGGWIAGVLGGAFGIAAWALPIELGRRVRLTGVSASHLVPIDETRLLFPDLRRERGKKLEAVAAALKERFGERGITRAALLDAPSRRR